MILQVGVLGFRVRLQGCRVDGLRMEGVTVLGFRASLEPLCRVSSYGFFVECLDK